MFVGLFIGDTFHDKHSSSPLLVKF